MTTFAALDYLLTQGAEVLLVECDNPPIRTSFARTTNWCPPSAPISMRPTDEFTS